MVEKARTNPDAKFKKQQAMTDLERAANEYKAERQATLDKTERLRALRLEKEAREAAERPAQPGKRVRRVRRVAR